MGIEPLFLVEGTWVESPRTSKPPIGGKLIDYFSGFFMLITGASVILCNHHSCSVRELLRLPMEARLGQ